MSKGASSSLKLKVITPRQLLVDEDVKEVTVPGLEGQLGILPGHRPLLVALGEGSLSYKVSNREQSFVVEGGYAEVQTDNVQVFTRLKDSDEQESDEGRG